MFLVTDVEATIKELANRYPATFAAEAWSPHRPLAIGIRDTLIAACPDLAGTITSALQRYTHRLVYQQSLVEGASRVDLSGAAVGTVSAQAAAHAAAKVEGILALRKAQAREDHRKPQAAPREAKQAVSPPPPTPKRLGLADLKRAALVRRGL